MKSLFPTMAAVAASAMLGAATYASPINPNLSGNTSYDGWADLTKDNFPNRNSATWAAPIGSNQAGSDDAEFNRIFGTAYPYEAFIYSSYLGGTFEMTDATPLPDLATVVFQIDIGEAAGAGLTSGGVPVLSYNGGTQQLTAAEQLVSSILTGTFTPPGSSEPEPIYQNTLLFQWDLTGITEAIESFSIAWSVAAHTQVYALRLDQSDVFTSAAVPEPASLALLGVGGLLVMVRRRKK